MMSEARNMNSPDVFVKRVMNKVDADTKKDVEMAESMGQRLMEMVKAGVLDEPIKPEPLTYADVSSHTNEERLSYYRSHGLDSCDDYPGGNRAFEEDVLSGREHDRTDHIGREDAYVLSCMQDGRFKCDSDFFDYTVSYSLRSAILRNIEKSGVTIMSSPGFSNGRSPGWYL